MIFVVKSYKKNKQQIRLLCASSSSKENQNNCSRSLKTSSSSLLFLLLFYARACITVVLQREILMRSVSFQRCLVFFKFFKFCLSSLFLLAGNGSVAQKHKNNTRRVKSILLCPKIALFFWAFSFCFGRLRTKKKKNISNDLLLSLRERDKNALLFDEMMRTTTTEKASLCVSCFSSLQRKKKTKKEVRLSVSLRSYTVSCNVILLSRFLSLSFSVSLSLWNDGTDF